MVSTSNECQLQLTLQTFEKDPQLNVRKVIRLYNILYSTLSIRINGVFVRATIIANSRKLIVLEEKVIVRKVLDLDSRGFPLRMYDIEDMVNRLLTIYDTIYVGPCWVFNFVKQQLKLRIRWNRLYDYQRVQYEDPEIIGVW